MIRGQYVFLQHALFSFMAIIVIVQSMH